MSTFKVGDRVKVIAQESIHRGAVASVLRVTHGHNLVLRTGEYRAKNVTTYEVDVPLNPGHCMGPGNACYLASDLAHYYDGNEKTSWSECAWQPRKITV